MVERKRLKRKEAANKSVGRIRSEKMRRLDERRASVLTLGESHWQSKLQLGVVYNSFVLYVLKSRDESRLKSRVYRGFGSARGRLIARACVARKSNPRTECGIKNYLRIN